MQLERMLGGCEHPVFHTYWLELHRKPPTPSNYVARRIWLEPPAMVVGGGWLRRFWRARGLRATTRFKWQLARRRHGFEHPRAAYLVVYNNAQAEYARHILEVLGIGRYVVHLMDLMERRGIDGLRGGAFEHLIRGATKVVAINSRLAAELVEWRNEPIAQFDMLAGFAARSLASLPSNRERTLLMTGALYDSEPVKMQFLREVFAPAWRQFKKTPAGSDVRWRYAGASFPLLDRAVAAEVENLGMVDNATLRQITTSARCGFLPVEHHASEHWRFSTPSRLLDFLTAGLPTIAPPNQGTATGDFLATHGGFTIVRNQEECLGALLRLFTDDARHRQQSEAALLSAARYDPETGRAYFQAILADLYRG
ncbi:MAG: hypothetical protein ABIY47_04345 [Opitutaceae bacterium]